MPRPEGRPPLVEEKTFIEVWNKHGGDFHAVAKELNMKPNSAWVRGNRLLKKHGVQRTKYAKATFELRYEDMRHEQ